ncbi:hypothetical protein X975_00264, partial [Stegodyphus mimosarum]
MANILHNDLFLVYLLNLSDTFYRTPKADNEKSHPKIILSTWQNS